MVDGAAIAARFRLWRESRASARQSNALFIWIPKNAGTSVFEMLRRCGMVKLKSTTAVRRYFQGSGRVTFGHIDIGALLESGLVSRDFVDSSFKFALTRDPYARAVSLYRYQLKHELGKWPEPPEFRDFLRLLARGDYEPIGLYNSRGLSQCNPQVEWLRPVQPDKLYKVERLEDLTADLISRWGLENAKLPHLNISTRPEDLNLSGEELGLIEQVYAEDFEELGYSKRRTTRLHVKPEAR